MSHGLISQPRNITIRPVIAELLRTCVHPAVLLLRVEHVIQKHLQRSLASLDEANPQEDSFTYSHSIKLFLTDGQLLIQALLHRKLANQSGVEELTSGDLIEIYGFGVKKAKRVNGSGHVVYLGIEDCHFIHTTKQPQVQAVQPLQDKNQHQVFTGAKRDRNHNDEGAVGDYALTAGGFVRENEEEQPPQKKVRRKGLSVSFEDTNLSIQNGEQRSHGSKPKADMVKEMTKTNTSQITPVRSARPHSNRSHKRSTSKLKLIKEVDSDDGDAFETLPINEATVRKRRRALHDLKGNNFKLLSEESPSKSTPTTSSTAMKHSRLHEVSSPIPVNTINVASKDSDASKNQRPHHTDTPLAPLVQTSTVSQTQSPPRRSAREPPFHTLRTILHPPPSAPLPRKNFKFTTLAIITYVGSSLITRPNSPFPPKRHIKIEDPSLHINPSQPNPFLHSNNLNVFSPNSPASTSSIPDKRGKGITVAIYRDATTFKPTVGTLALFRGLIMQRLSNGDVILNIYPRKSTVTDMTDPVLEEQKGQHEIGDKLPVEVKMEKKDDKQTFQDGEWFIDDRDRLKKIGYAVEGLAIWWDRRKKELSSK